MLRHLAVSARRLVEPGVPPEPARAGLRFLTLAPAQVVAPLAPPVAPLAPPPPVQPVPEPKPTRGTRLGDD